MPATTRLYETEDETKAEHEAWSEIKDKYDEDDRYRGQEISNSLFLNITQYCLNSDLVGQTTLKILKLNHR